MYTNIPSYRAEIRDGVEQRSSTGELTTCRADGHLLRPGFRPPGLESPELKYFSSVFYKYYSKVPSISTAKMMSICRCIEDPSP